MSSLEKIQGFLAKGVAEKVFPGCALYVGCHGKKIVTMEAGFLDGFSGKKVTHETIYDLASLTKPLATALAVIKARESGLLNFDDPVSRYLGLFAGKKEMLIPELLCHIAGLPAHREYYKTLVALPLNERKKRLAHLIAAEESDSGCEKKVVYSDIGYMLLHLILEEASGEAFDDFVYDSVYRPWGIDNLFFPNDSKRELFLPYIAPTEDVSYRGGRISGEVHDDNAWALGGFSGHAGLFGSAEGVGNLLGRLVREYESPELFLRSSMKLFFEEQKPFRRTGGGLDMPENKGSSSGDCFTAESTGHLGFTGTSFWIDLQKHVEVVFLSNRVWYGSDKTKIQQFRPVLHNLVMDFLCNAGYIYNL